jgi:hypothetical protein
MKIQQALEQTDQLVTDVSELVKAGLEILEVLHEHQRTLLELTKSKED